MDEDDSSPEFSDGIEFPRVLPRTPAGHGSVNLGLHLVRKARGSAFSTMRDDSIGERATGVEGFDRGEQYRFDALRCRPSRCLAVRTGTTNHVDDGVVEILTAPSAVLAQPGTGTYAGSAGQRTFRPTPVPARLVGHLAGRVTGPCVRRSARATDPRDPCGGRTHGSFRPAPRAATSALHRCHADSRDHRR